MMGSFETSYQQFVGEENEQFVEEEIEGTPRPSVVHVVPENGKAAKWNHIEDLDNFFTRVYQYHQRHGFKNMVLDEFLGLLQLFFVVFTAIFCLNCIDYEILYGNKIVEGTNKTKGSVSDSFLSYDQCRANVNLFEWYIVFVASSYWLLRIIKFVFNSFHYWDIRAFFNSALNIRDRDLQNVTWHDVQKKVREVQLEQQMCIHKKDLTELDIYHRILRFKNYMVAMVNKSLLPPKFKLPFIGDVTFMSYGLKYNLEMILFWGPWAPFKNNWHLKDDYKRPGKRIELAQNLSKIISYIAIVNIFIQPIMVFYLVFYSFFNYTEIIRRDPSFLGLRHWSLYGKYYFRHFNELDHELNARLSRAYRPATKYLSSFTNPTAVIYAKHAVFVIGSFMAIILVMAVSNNAILNFDHISLLTFLGLITTGFRSFIPDENLIWWPENLLGSVLAQVHYLPSHWRGLAHTQTVRDQFSDLFELKITFLLTELVSPILTPILLLTHIRPRVLEFVDFFRNFTVEVAGVGDVCSFAQMDIRANGNPDWNPGAKKPTSNQYTQAEEGKIELSLAHFTLTNPEWTPPSESAAFISVLREEAKKQLIQNNALSSSFMSTMQMQPYDSLVLQNSYMLNGRSVHTNISRFEGPASERNKLNGMSLGASVFGIEYSSPNPVDNTPMDMSRSALCLHRVHQRGIERRIGVRQPNINSAAENERAPLLQASPSRLS